MADTIPAATLAKPPRIDAGFGIAPTIADFKHIKPFDAEINLSTVLLTGFKNPVLLRSNNNPIKIFNNKIQKTPPFLVRFNAYENLNNNKIRFQ
jgi:hypothetical protein